MIINNAKFDSIIVVNDKNEVIAGIDNNTQFCKNGYRIILTSDEDDIKLRRTINGNMVVIEKPDFLTES